MEKNSKGGTASGRKNSGADCSLARREKREAQAGIEKARGLTRRWIAVPQERVNDLHLFGVYLCNNPTSHGIPWASLLEAEEVTQSKEQLAPGKTKRKRPVDPRQLNLFDMPGDEAPT